MITEEYAVALEAEHRRRQRERAGLAERVARPSAPPQAPAEWPDWLATMFPESVTHEMAPHHRLFWDHVWSLGPESSPRPFFGIWSREGGKSTNVELACLALGVRGRRRYIIYVRKTQEAADGSVQNIKEKLESASVERYYPVHSRPMLSKFGATRGWRRNRLHTAGGLTIDALGLDAGSIRGLKVGDNRPDLVIFDDIDDEDDTPGATAKKRKRITTAVLPAAARDRGAVIGIQNLIIADGIFTTIVDGRADYLTDRIVSGPHPAVRNLEWQWVDDETTGTRVPKITAGEPTWAGQGLETCEAQMRRWGPTSFLREAQHQVKDRPEGLALNFDEHEHYIDLTLAQIRELVQMGQVFGGVDFQAWRFAFLLFAANEQGVAIRIGEIFSQREELSVRASRMHALCELLGVVQGPSALVRVPLWGDSANPQDIIEINAAFKRQESPLRVVGVGRDAKLRRAAVQRINDKLAERAIRYVRVLPRCSRHDARWLLGYNAGSAGTPMLGSRLIWELDHWSYPVPPEGKVDLREDPDDHSADGADMMAAQRYALMSWWRPGKKEEMGELDAFAPETLQAEVKQRYTLVGRRKRARTFSRGGYDGDE